MNFEIDESRVSKYGVDLIGQIDANLTHLRGYGVMAFELIQNADDAGAREISIDVTDNALIIKNDAEFSSCSNRQDDNCLRDQISSHDMCDWHAFRLIASGAKSERSVTTIGRFGLGFTSVFQITDNPSVECSGSKLTIYPETESSTWKKITVTSGTTFTLPWAFDAASSVRSRLKNAGVVTQSELSKILTKINDISSETLVFLKNLEKISILNNGKVKSVFRRNYDESRKLLTIIQEPGNRGREYFYTFADFSSNLNLLEKKYPRQLGEKKRRHLVEIAIPREFDSSKSGLIYAYLPTERNTLMAMSINGDFYPDSSRKDIILEKQAGNDAFSEWNRCIIECSASLFNSHLDDIYSFLKFKNFWKLIQSIHDLNEKIYSYGSDVSTCFGSFWNRFQLFSASLPLLPTEGEEIHSHNLSSSYLLEGEDIQEKRLAVRVLGINTPSSKIKQHFTILKKLNIEDIDFNVIVASLRNKPWVKVPKPQIHLNDSEFREIYLPVFTLLDSYIPKDSAGLIFRDSLAEYRKMPILISNTGSLETPANLYVTEVDEIQDLVCKLNPQIKFLSRELTKFSRIKGSCKYFGLDDAANLIQNLLAMSPHLDFAFIQLMHQLLTKISKPAHFQDENLQKLRALKIWPTTDGDLIGADEGVIPGDFTDPLGNTHIIDDSKLDKLSRDFLTGTLQVKVLSIESYVQNHLPKVFSVRINNINPNSYQRLLEELAKHYKKFENKDLIAEMQKLHFIPTESGTFLRILESAVGTTTDKSRLAGVFDSWFDTKYFPDSKIVRQFLETLGLRNSPEARILAKVLNDVLLEQQSKLNRSKIIKIVDYVLDKKNSYEDTEINDFFSSLPTNGFLPAKNDFVSWYLPGELISPEAADLVSSQIQLKVLDFCDVESKSPEIFISKCGVKAEPATEDVVAHVKYCAFSRVKVSNKVLRFLNKLAARKQDRESITCLQSLRDVAFLPVQDGFVRPADLYRELHKIGAPWAFLLPKELDFSDLIDVWGVKQSPDGNDLIRILEDIKVSYLNSGEVQLPENHRAAYLQCWELLNYMSLQDSLEDYQIENLMESELFLNQQFEFKSREYLIVPDSEWFREEFKADFEVYFILDDHIYSHILKRLNFKYLSKNLQAKLFSIKEPISSHPILKREILLRAENISAALAQIEGKNQELIDWKSLDVYQAGSIQVEWLLRFEDKELSAIRTSHAFADFINHKLYVTDDLNEIETEFNWVKMFKELFDQLFPAETRQALSGAVSIVSTLMLRSPESGLRYLEDVGIETGPRKSSIDFSNPELKEATFDLVDDLDKNREFSKGQDIELKFEDADNLQGKNSVDERENAVATSPPSGPLPTLRSSEPQERHQNSQPPYLNSNSHSDLGQAKSQGSDLDRGKSTRDVRSRPRPTGHRSNVDRVGDEVRRAFIYAQREVTLEGIQSQKHKMENEDISRKIVLHHERSEGREPEEMSVGNEGYDIESTEPNGDIRYIEIKSTKSYWGRDGVTLSSAQLNMAYRKKDAFWLYVIEKVSSSEPRIYKIQNPAKYILGFKLNDAWKEIAISLEYSTNNAELIESGIGEEDIGSRILHIERGECFLIGWRQQGESVMVSLQFDEVDEIVVLPLNITKMKKLKL